MRKLFRKRKGQNTVEYLLMMAVIVGLVLIIGVAMKQWLPAIFASVSQMISGATGTLSKGN
jgi:Flp pilus assembly pilin Flp